MATQPTPSFFDRAVGFLRSFLGGSVRDQIVNHAIKLIGTKYDDTGNRSKGYLDDDVMDCSEFVYQVYTRAGVTGFPPLNSHAIADSGDFEKVTDPVKADIVYWTRGHVAIVVNPTTGEFIGAQSSGVNRSNYLQNIFWMAQPGRSFYRFKKLPR